MGTNYYTIAPKECDSCGNMHECSRGVHLGKSSAGWRFTFQYNGGRYYKSEPEMREWLKGRTIYDEYGEGLSYDEFWKMVDSKREAELHHGLAEYRDSHTVEVGGVVFTDCEFS